MYGAGTFTVEFRTNNAAMSDDDYGPEVARILRHVADSVEHRSEPEESDGGPIMDANGNNVGTWSIEPTKHVPA